MFVQVQVKVQQRRSACFGSYPMNPGKDSVLSALSGSQQITADCENYAVPCPTANTTQQGSRRDSKVHGLG